MDALVRRLRELGYRLTAEARDSWPEHAERLSKRAGDVQQAADIITSLVVALEGLVKAVDENHDVYDDEGKELAELVAARAALREVGRG